MVAGSLQLVAFGASAEHTGSFTVADGATLQFGGNALHQLSPTALLSGEGAVALAAPFSLGADLDLGGLDVTLRDAGTLEGNFILTFGPTGSLTVLKSLTFPGSIVMGGHLDVPGVGTVFTVSRTLTLAATGTIANQGTLRAGQFLNLAGPGSITGNAPVEIGLPGPGASVRISLVPPGREARTASDGPARDQVRLNWDAPAGLKFVVEASRDCQHWMKQKNVVGERSPGRYEVSVGESDLPDCFYRVRQGALQGSFKLDGP